MAPVSSEFRAKCRLIMELYVIVTFLKVKQHSYSGITQPLLEIEG